MSKHPKRLFFIRKSSQKIVVAQQNMRNWLILTYPIITFGNECPIGVHKKLLPYVLILPKKILVFTNYELSRTLTFLFKKWRVWIIELLQCKKAFSKRHTEHQGTEIDIWEFLDVVVCSLVPLYLSQQFCSSRKKGSQEFLRLNCNFLQFPYSHLGWLQNK